MELVISALYCKGRLARSKEDIQKFFNEKFDDKKMNDVIENFYNNDYSDIDNTAKDFFMSRLLMQKTMHFST